MYTYICIVFLQLGNHDQRRIASRKGPEYADALNLMLLTLPGTPTTYQGEEIAMRDVEIPFEESMDPFGLYFGPVSISQVAI